MQITALEWNKRRRTTRCSCRAATVARAPSGSRHSAPWSRARIVKHRRPQLIPVFYGRMGRLPRPDARRYNVMRGRPALRVGSPQGT
jgi:hypothetical protein